MFDWLEALDEFATPDLYERNAFRLLEMPVEATSRELTRRRDYVQRATSSNFAVPPGPARMLARNAAPDAHEVQQAEHAIQDAERRLIHEFFWFWPLALAGPPPPIRRFACWFQAR